MRRPINIHHPWVKEYVEKAEAGLKELEDLAQQEGAIAKSFIAYNKENFDLTEHVSEYNPDYVVIGSQGAKGVKALFFGSNAQRIIRHSPCPTLVIKEEPEDVQIKEIAFASFFHEEDQKPFRQVVKFAEDIQANVSLLYVKTPFIYESRDTIEGRIQNFLQQMNGHSSTTFKTFVEFGKYSEEGMLDFIKGQHMDLLALATSGKKGILGVLKHSFTEKVVNHIEQPVLTILAQ